MHQLNKEWSTGEQPITALSERVTKRYDHLNPVSHFEYGVFYFRKKNLKGEKETEAMKTKMILCSFVLLFSLFSRNASGATEGVYNTSYGWLAGASITDGTCNTFLGSGAGTINATGSYNTFLGYQAGGVNQPSVGDATSASNNTFLGYQAGKTNSTGKFNTFLGSDAGWNNTTGIANNIMGFAAGFQNTTGSYNTFIGYEAGYSNSTGRNNNFIGYYAGYANTAGYSNTFIGHYAGFSNTTGSGNVFLGHNAGKNETGSNKLYISNSDTATPLIYGDFSTGTVVIHGKITLQSSREVKDEIASLTAQEAMDALDGLRPVTFVYRADRTERHMGFIAEDLPEPVSTKDRKGVNPMDIVTVLTKVVQEQQKIVDQQQGIITSHAEKIAKLERLLAAKGN